MSDLAFFGIVLFVVVLIFVKGMLDQKKAAKEYLEEYKNEYGNRSYRDISPDELLSTKAFFLRKTKEADNELIIDDITWNDLDMDLLFKRIDKTLSQPGTEVLYNMLRHPKPCDDVEKKEKLISYFQDNAEDRAKLIMILKNIGRMGKYSFSDYVDSLDKCEQLNMFKHWFCLFFGVVSLILIFAVPPLGFICMFFSLFYNIFSYFAAKNEIKKYISVFAYILRLLKYSESFLGIDVDIISGEKEEIKSILQKTSEIKKGAFLVMNQGGATGNFADIILDYFRMYFHLDLLRFNYMLKTAREQKNYYIRLWEIIGNIDAYIAIGNFRASLPYYSTPDFCEDKIYECMDLFHPLLEKPISNSLNCDKCMLLTGSNASGKSTFLKTVAINAILSQTINTSVSAKYCAPHFAIMTSMALSDSIAANESYYMAEIKALKRILKTDCSDCTILCCIDEVLRGTNTAERIAASASVLEHISKKGILCFAATHDLELSTLLAKNYANYHFSENIEDNKISFPYKLFEGATNSRNAIKLLSLMGFDESIVNAADKRCKDFLESNVWT